MLASDFTLIYEFPCKNMEKILHEMNVENPSLPEKPRDT